MYQRGRYHLFSSTLFFIYPLLRTLCLLKSEQGVALGSARDRGKPRAILEYLQVKSPAVLRCWFYLYRQYYSFHFSPACTFYLENPSVIPSLNPVSFLGVSVKRTSITCGSSVCNMRWERMRCPQGCWSPTGLCFTLWPFIPNCLTSPIYCVC